jgi:hypothetical protein
MNVKFDTRDTLSFLSREVEMIILDLQLTELPFKCRRTYAQVGQRAHHHIAADPGKAVEVQNRHQGN